MIEDITSKVGDVEVPSIWYHPEEHKKAMDELLQREADSRGISKKALLKEKYKQIEELAKAVEYRMIGANGFGGPIFVYEEKPNKYYNNIKEFYSKIKNYF